MLVEESSHLIADHSFNISDAVVLKKTPAFRRFREAGAAVYLGIKSQRLLVFGQPVAMYFNEFVHHGPDIIDR